MTSLLGRLLQPFSDGLPLEDLFTEADVQLLETRRNRPVRFVLDALVELGEHADDEGTRVLLQPLNRYDDYMLSRLDQRVELAETMRRGSVKVMEA